MSSNLIRELRFEIQKIAQSEFENLKIEEKETEGDHEKKISEKLKKIFSPIVGSKSQNLTKWEGEKPNETRNKIIWFSAHYWSEYYNFRIREMFENIEERNSDWFWDDPNMMNTLKLFFDYYHPESLLFQLIFLRSKRQELNEPIVIHFSNEKSAREIGYNYLHIPKALLEIEMTELIKQFQIFNTSQSKEILLRAKAQQLNWMREHKDFMEKAYEKYKTLLSSLSTNEKAKCLLEIMHFLDSLASNKAKEYKDILIYICNFFQDNLGIETLTAEQALHFIYSYSLFRKKENKYEFVWNWLYYLPVESLHLKGGGISFVTQEYLTPEELSEFQSLTNNILNCSALKEAQEKYALPMREANEDSYKIMCGTVLFDKLNELQEDPPNQGNRIPDWEKNVLLEIQKFQAKAIHLNHLIGLKMISNEILVFYRAIIQSLGIPQILVDLISRALEYEDRLREIKGYRQNFIHSFHIFLLGYYILKKLITIKPELIEKITPSSLIKVNDYKSLIKAWLLSSLIHDITYPIEKMKDWIDEFAKTLIAKDESDKEKKELLPIYVSMGNLFAIDDYLYCLTRDLSKNLCEVEAINETDKQIKFERDLVRHILEKRDHGLLSALFLLSRLWNKGLNKEVLKWSSLMIAIHTFCERCGKTKEKCSSCENKKDVKSLFLPYLFEYVDNVQQWGRPESRKEEIEKDFKKISLVTLDVNDNKVVCRLNYESSLKDKGEWSSQKIIDEYYKSQTNKWVKDFVTQEMKYQFQIFITIDSKDDRGISW